MFAHDGHVTKFKFVRITHYLTNVVKDGLINYWDCDNFNLLLELRGHHAELWSLAISNQGDYVITADHVK